MFVNDFLWAIAPTHVDMVMRNLAADIQRAIEAGHTDDAERAGLPVARAGSTALVTLKGPMLKDAGWLRFYGWASTVHTMRAVQAADADDDVDDIVIEIDSPGGSVAGLDELSDAVAAASKPVIVQGTGMIASAAYHVASQADRIYTQRMDLIGSIGVRTMLYDYSKHFEELGIKAIPIDTGVHKSAGAFGTEITDEQAAEVQRIIDGYMDEFVDRVATGRDMAPAAVREVGDGRVFFAGDAQERGLIDGIQTLEQTMASLAPKRPAGERRKAMALMDLNESR